MLAFTAVSYFLLLSAAGGTLGNPLLSAAGGIRWDLLLSAAGGIPWNMVSSFVFRLSPFVVAFRCFVRARCSLSLLVFRFYGCLVCFRFFDVGSFGSHFGFMFCQIEVILVLWGSFGPHFGLMFGHFEVILVFLGGSGAKARNLMPYFC